MFWFSLSKKKNINSATDNNNVYIVFYTALKFISTECNKKKSKEVALQDSWRYLYKLFKIPYQFIHSSDQYNFILGLYM